MRVNKTNTNSPKFTIHNSSAVRCTLQKELSDTCEKSDEIVFINTATIES